MIFAYNYKSNTLGFKNEQKIQEQENALSHIFVKF